MEIPVEVLKAAKGLVDEFGQSFDHLGERDGVTYYAFAFPDRIVTGYPIVFAYRDGKPVEEIDGEDALDVVCSFVK